MNEIDMLPEAKSNTIDINLINTERNLFNKYKSIKHQRNCSSISYLTTKPDDANNKTSTINNNKLLGNINISKSVSLFNISNAYLTDDHLFEEFKKEFPKGETD